MSQMSCKRDTAADLAKSHNALSSSHAFSCTSDMTTGSLKSGRRPTRLV